MECTQTSIHKSCNDDEEKTARSEKTVPKIYAWEAPSTQAALPATQRKFERSLCRARQALQSELFDR
jgi:hypothetical protein